MLSKSLTLLLCETVASAALCAQVNPAISFLQDMIGNPTKIATQEEGIRMTENIRAAANARSAVPVAFSALHARSLQAQLHGALALHSIATRPDGPSILSGEGEAILELLSLDEPRLKATAIILTEIVRIPASVYEQRFIRFLADPSQPAEVKPGIIRLLIQSTTSIDEKKGAIAKFLEVSISRTVRFEAFNAIASHPADQAWHADLVAIGLRDPDEEVRLLAIALLEKLGPNSVLLHGVALNRLAQNANESTKNRQATERALSLKH